MKTIRPLYALVLTGLLASCATAPTQLADTSAVPQDRQLAGWASLTTPADGKVKVTIVRDSGFFGADMRMALSIDGQLMAKIKAGEKVDVYLSPGTHIFGAAPWKKDRLTEAAFQIGEGLPQTYRITLEAGSGIRFQPSAAIR